jgi:hypothetical protein
MPTVSESSESAKLGILFSFGQDLDWTGVHIADYIDKIIPLSLIARADEVIE